VAGWKGLYSQRRETDKNKRRDLNPGFYILRMTMASKLGILCLITAVIMMILFDVRILLVLGFLYYAYKILYKKEELKRLDKILILCLFVLFLLEIFLLIYYSATYLNIPQNLTS
jgi:succinate dehydrogenase/fumarate reductase cytochrome b subunit